MEITRWEGVVGGHRSSMCKGPVAGEGYAGSRATSGFSLVGDAWDPAV